MKTILIPTDFSENATIAVNYGFNIAKKMKAKVVLFHANHVPVITPNTPASVYDELIKSEEAKVIKKLYKLREEYIEKFEINEDEQSVEAVVSVGFATDEVIEYSKEKDVSLIVMGTQGAGGLKKLIIGTNAASIIRNSPIPVLAVPNNYKDFRLKKAILAADFKSNDDRNQFDIFVDICELFDVKLEILHIKKDDDMNPTESQVEKSLAIESAFKKVQHEYVVLQETEIEDTVLEYAEKEESDLIITLPRRQNFFLRLFNNSVTSEIAFKTKIPLLTLPNK
jgi:nucleotide-binding universal stress UspA family protein